MAEFTNVVIGIQARSTSKRFPRKVFELIDGKPVLQHVIDACNKAAHYMNNHTHKTRVIIKTALVVPEGDEIVPAFKRRVTIIEGSENDVLSRYKTLSDRLGADYIVRITADCPLIPPPYISKSIKTALINGYDYYSNVDTDIRLSVDGHDVEVISSAVLDWASKTAVDPSDREHVTTLIRRSPPDWARLGHTIGFWDCSATKLSVDTLEDLERVRAHYGRRKSAIEECERRYGKGSAHSF